MNESDNTVTKPLAGFFPGFYDIGETYPLVKIAKRYHELGGEVVFFSHGGQYEYLAKELDFKIIRFEILKSVSPIDRMGYFFCMDDEELMRFIQREALAFSNVGIKVLVHPNVFF